MIEKKIVAAYEEMADSYDALIDHKPHNAYYDRPNTLALLPDVSGKSVLDAACGPGKYAEILIGQGARVTGFDISPRMIALARKRNKAAGTFFVQDLNKPFATLTDGSFDIVICALAMHYLRDWTLTIREYCRVLKPGGLLILSIEHPFFEFNYFKSAAYFSIEPVQCVWTAFGKPIEVNSYRRSLSECITPLTENGFYLDRLVEPKPVEAFEQYDPKHFKELNEFPAFLCLRAVKRD
ncbi:class I SAM-dependent methyltransferase [Spirosoma koreense]